MVVIGVLVANSRSARPTAWINAHPALHLNRRMFDAEAIMEFVCDLPQQRIFFARFRHHQVGG
ncbi:MAG TPA: hypothetical protein VL096_01470, partial [Pirellulaceae bacterium]|nr:hypothetical protein [Pirellulaceae bacterium]